MITRQRLCMVLLSLVLSSVVATAQQSGGQVCLRAFEDRNENSLLDAGEPFITRGISATLADADGIIVETRLIDNAPTAAQGTLCFQRLAPGQYTMRVLSADYNATTETTFVTAVSATGVPQVFDYGGAPLTVTTGDTSTSAPADFTLTPAEQRRLLTRLFVSGVGAAIMMGFMVVLGAIIFFLFVRRRSAPTQTMEHPAAPNRTTGQVPAVNNPPINDRDDYLDGETISLTDPYAYLDDDEPEDRPFRPPQN